jgi:RimJ/RimL family protein N-acetyltransferase
MLPPGSPLIGETAVLVPLQPSHAPSLYKHLGGKENLWRWTYMPSEGYLTFSAFEAAVAAWIKSSDLNFYAVQSRPEDTAAAGMMAYVAVAPEMRRLEIGYVILGEPLTRSRAATEAFYLFIRHAFDDLGYTRVEWKANRLNEASMRAAYRLGFLHEGVFKYVHDGINVFSIRFELDELTTNSSFTGST